ncbi:MAG: murein L,D-transpeptidase catalytic domain family protein [Methanococcaceae archaeon]
MLLIRKTILYILFFLIPIINNAGVDDTNTATQFYPDLYTTIHLADCGLQKEVFELALKGLKKLDTIGKLQKRDVITIADYSQSSKQKRLYVIDLKNQKLLFNTYVAHGRNTGEEYARSFSNAEGSLKSSLGFFVTNQTMIGAETGFALTLQGVEKGINDNAERRAIIMHAADYATENFIKVHGRLGRSFGCPALPPEMNKPIIETIKGGSCLFIYNPDNNYLAQSSLLN